MANFTATASSVQVHKTPLKVMHVIEDLENGGAERVLINLVAGLPVQFFQTMVCCLAKKGRMAAELEERGLRVIALHKRPGVDVGLLWRLQKLLRAQQIDILHTHVFTANLWGRLAGILARVPVLITHEHSTFTIADQTRRGIEQQLARTTTQIISVSEQLRRCLIETGGLPADKVITIHNGLRLPVAVNQATQMELQRELDLERFSPLIGSIGRQEVRKNYPLLLEAMPKILEHYPQAGLLLVGEGPETSHLKQLAQAKGLAENVIFAGHRQEIYELLSFMSVFCLPSQTEGISMAILEALAAKVPVVATRVGGNPEIILDDRYGLLVPPNDKSAFTGALLQTLQDRETAGARAQAGQKFVQENFSEQQMIQRITALYLTAYAQKCAGNVATAGTYVAKI